MKVLKAMGIKSIINFRTNSHKGRKKIARKLGLSFYHIKTGIAFTPELPEIREFLGIISNPVNRPCFVCCNIGIDRTAYYVAVYRIAFEGWTVQQADDEMRAHGLKQWWYTFTKYKNSLRANEAAIRSIARELNCLRLAPQTFSNKCHCIQLGSMKKLYKNPYCLKEIEKRNFEINEGTKFVLNRSDAAGTGTLAESYYLPDRDRIGPLANRLYAIRLQISGGVDEGKFSLLEANDFYRELMQIRSLEDCYATVDGYVTREQKLQLYNETEKLAKSIESKLKDRKKIVARNRKKAIASVGKVDMMEKPLFLWCPSRHGDFYDASGLINGRIPLQELGRYGGTMFDGTPVSKGAPE